MTKCEEWAEQQTRIYLRKHGELETLEELEKSMGPDPYSQEYREHYLRWRNNIFRSFCQYYEKNFD